MSVETVVIGARGYTGGELLPLLLAHPECTLTAVGSSTAKASLVAGRSRDGWLRLASSDIGPADVGTSCRLFILAFPMGRHGNTPGRSVFTMPAL
jgi:N-acetyl-gamma-glutamylphosphate reductase